MKKETTLTIEEASRQVELVCRRLGMLHLAFARELVEELGQEEGERLTTKAIKRYAHWIGSAKREKADKADMELSPDSYVVLSDLPSFGMHSGIEEVEIEGEARIRAYGCVMGEVWREMGEEKLGRIYCYVDPAGSMAFNRDYKLVHTMALPDGDPFCELVFRPTIERDREQFDADETDWEEIEKSK